MVTCGPGKDSAQLDLVDVITDATAAKPKGSCETVQRARPKKGQDNTENKTESPSQDGLQA